MTSPHRPSSTLLGGRYELRSLLATGGMGQVWRGRDVVLQRTVAVKVLRSEYTGDATFLARFRAEAQHSALLTHRNIAALFDYGESTAADGEALAYLVMELVEGESLAQVLAREGRLPVDRTLDVLHQTATGLAAAHAAGLVHRDVKPGNLLVGDDGTVKITDFGIAWSAASAPLTQTGQVVGTAHYLSPEQAGGSKAGPASDIYALGMIGFECLAGHRAFDGDNSVQIALRQLREEPPPLPADVPEQVRTLIERALLKDPAERYPDGAAFRDAVDDVRAGRLLPPVARPAGTRPLDVLPAPAPAPAARPLRLRLLAPLVALVVGVGLGIAALQVWGDAPADAGGGSSEAPEPVVLAAADFVGRPVAEVEAELASVGLGVELVGRESDAVPADHVLELAPVGAVAPGTVVLVTYAIAPQEPEPAPVAPAPAPEQPVTPVPVPVGDGGGGDEADDDGDGGG
ncbi:protein kinase, partial [Blastococcus sp. MG754426]|uniref:protein kinase domain-containing protein n=2 Tax=unclassified Blastococcus TaxID=2619396 RepID=UPI001F02AF85